MSSTWASVVPAGTVPKDTAPPLRGPLRPSWRAGFSPIPTKSGASKASRLILGSWERRRPGPASAASRSLQKIVGAIVGAASRAGREHLQGSSPPRSTGGRDGGRGETVRGCVTWGEGVPPFFLDGAAGKAWRPDPGCKRVVGGSWGFAPLSPRRDTSTNRTPHTVWSTPRCGSPEAGRAPR